MAKNKRVIFLTCGLVCSGSQVRYALRDDFTDTRAAGAVNGTPATPGPGARVATDGNSKLSVGAGVLDFATGGVGAGDPGLWYAGLTRAAGRLIVFECTFTAGSPNIGFDTNQTGSTTSDHFRLSATNLQTIESGAVITVGAAAAATSYKLAIVLRASGSYFFIKGGAYTFWTLVWIGTVGTSATLYPILGVRTGTASVWTNAFMRSPAALWIPAPLAWDSFTQADGALVASDTTGPDGTTISARAWTGATWAVSSNKAVNTPPLGAELATGTLTIGTWYQITATEAAHFYAACAVGDTFRATAETALDASNKVKPFTLADLFASLPGGSANVMASVKLSMTAALRAGLVVCLDDPANPANFLIAYHDGVNARLDKCVAGTYTALINTAAAYAADAALVVSKNGEKIRLYYNSTLIGTEQTVSDAGIISNTAHGLFSTAAANTFINFGLRPKGNAGEYVALDKYAK